MKIIIDRFEGDFARVELPDGAMIDMPKALVPTGAKEGDVINISIDQDETARRSQSIDALMNNLFN